MKKALINVPVLLIFFNRPNTFEQVFAKVRESRPSKLFLACDGARAERKDDEENIAKCKEIAKRIDWECEVHQRYLKENVGCGVGPQSAITWALNISDRIVILEDDCVPEISFFGYMAELLEKYKDDERVGMISGLNHFKEWNCSEYSYFFTKTGAIWGWGTWRRVWDKYDYTVSGITNAYVRKLLTYDITLKRARKPKIALWEKAHRELVQQMNISYWDIQFGFLKFYQNYITITPKHNLIHNIGVGVNSTHAKNQKDKEWKLGMLHYIPVQSIQLPLSHPSFMICDREYDNSVDGRFGYPYPTIRQLRRIIRLIRLVFNRG